MKLSKNLAFVILSVLIMFGGVLRLYAIDSVPVSLYWDEAASTYNAYSIALTGKDEYGNLLPLLFRSFDDYKMSGNIYLTAIIVKIFGMNEFSARASSAFLGTATILLSYLFIKELVFFVKKKPKRAGFFYELIEKLNPTTIALLTAGLVALSPWHIQFSRTGFEANVAVFFLLLGTWLFLKGQAKYVYFILAMVIYGISVYFYRSVHVFLPLFLVGLFLIFRQELLKIGIKRAMLGVLLFLIIVLPLAPWMLSEGGLARVRQVNFANEAQDDVYKAALQQHERGNDLVGKIVYNRRFIYAKEVVQNYISHFSLSFLFLAGDGNGRHGPIGMGLLYLWELPFLLFGLIMVFFMPPKIRNLLLLWILISPIPAALSIPSPHALRSLNVIPMPQLLTALGICGVYISLQKRYRIVYAVGLICVGTFFFIQYLTLYYSITAQKTSKDWADGYKQLTQYIFANEYKYDKVIVSGHYWQPYIYFLFYKAYDPALFQKKGSNIMFDKYYFGGTSWDKDKGRSELDNENLEKIAGTKRALIALSPPEYASQKARIKKLTEIRNHNNELVFIVGELQ